MGDDNAQRRGPRSKVALAALAIGAALLFAVFAALGTWQVKRLFWKLDLIERVDQRVSAPAVTAPGPAQWPGLNTGDDEYRHVQAQGIFLHEHETLVQAVTVMGSGFWVLTPLRLADGTVLMVNRGFVPPEVRERARRQATEAKGLVTVTGLLRLSEPDGGFLRRNDPTAKRWYSRDVQAMATAHGLDLVAPYFVDQEAAARPSSPSASAEQQWPAGGLTVVTFKNNHLVYAITWFTLALMVLGAARYVRRDELRLRRPQSDQNAR